VSIDEYQTNTFQSIKLKLNGLKIKIHIPNAYDKVLSISIVAIINDTLYNL